MDTVHKISLLVIVVSLAVVGSGLVHDSFAQSEPRAKPPTVDPETTTETIVTAQNDTINITINMPEPEPDHMVAIRIPDTRPDTPQAVISCPGVTATQPAWTLSHRHSVFDETPRGIWHFDEQVFRHEPGFTLGYKVPGESIPRYNTISVLVHSVNIVNDVYTVKAVGGFYHGAVACSGADTTYVVPITITGTCSGSEFLLLTTPNNFNVTATNISAACVTD